MAEKQNVRNKAGALRKQADKAVRQEAPDTPENLEALPPQAMGKLLHELRIHQVELDIQNLNLREALVKLEGSRSRYFELFDVAPVGYFNIDKIGIIQEVNLTGANMLGAVPQDLRKYPFSNFILKEDKKIYHLHRKQIFETQKPQLWEMRMASRDGSLFWARSEATLSPGGSKGQTECRMAISDITRQKQSEHLLEERIKEQQCLYRIMSLIVDKDSELDEMLNEIVMLIPQGWHSPEIAEACIVVEGQAFQTARFRETAWRQARNIIAAGEMIGQVEVCYLEYPRAVTEKPFLPEEESLLDAIAQRLGQIVSRIRAEQALKTSENHYRTVVETANDGICVLQDGLLKFVNRALTEIAGSSAEEMLGKSFFDYIHPDDRAMIIERELRRLSGANFETTYPFRALDKEGKTRWIEVSVALATWEGKPATLNFLKDVTDFKLAEKDLKTSNDNYRLLADNTVDGIWLLDMDLKLTYCSPAAEKQSGFTAQEIMEMSMAEYFTPQSFQAVTELFLREMPRVEADPDYKGNASLDLEFLRKDGTSFWAECKFRIIRDVHRKPQSVLVMARDITERKQTEAKLLEGYNTLRKTLNDAIDTMARIVEMRDPYTAGHQRRVAVLATDIARKMKWEDARIDRLRMAALVHDIGKIYIPSDMLTKPGKLEDLEFELIKTHAQYGYDIVKGMDFAASISKAVLQHHERMDGSGYPNQLKGKDILLEAKILAVADVVEAMSSTRPYRPPLGIEKALEEIVNNRGTLYDPEVVDACVEICKNGESEFNSA